MTYALIDNASLTAVERVLGQIVARNPDTINGDLVALENVVQAILFYDDLVSIDNYKEEFREARAKKFGFVNFLAPSSCSLGVIEETAKAEAESIEPEIRGGEFSDKDFKQLLEMLKLNMVCTWDMRSSVYYLTMKMLGQPNTPEYEKYSGLSASIFNELADAGETKGRWSTKVTLISSSGHVYQEQEFSGQRGDLAGTTKALAMFIAALNWMAYKSIYYSLAAKHLKADSFIHPIRHAYQIHWMKKTGAFGHDFTSRLLGNLTNKISTSISEIVGHGRTSTIALDLPIFSAWLTQEADGVEGVIASALELKRTDHFQTVRQTLREIRLAYDEHGVSIGNAKVTALIRDVERVAGDLKRKYGVPSNQGIQGSFLIKSINSATALAGIPPLPDHEFAISTPEFLKSAKTRALTTVFKDVVNELTSIERLGGLRDKMASSFKIDDSRYIPPKTEDPRFRKVNSHWKMPM